MPSASAVLIVEDDVPTQQLLSALVRRHGLQSRIAGDGRAALRDLRVHDADVILLDLLLPEVDGMEVLRQVAGTMPHLLHRIIVITAAAESVYRGCETLEAVWNLLRKPFDLRVLETQILGCCAERRRQLDGDPATVAASAARPARTS